MQVASAAIDVLRAQFASYQIVFAIQGPFFIAVLGAAYTLRRPGMRAYAWVYGLLTLALAFSALSVTAAIAGGRENFQVIALALSMGALGASWAVNRDAVRALGGLAVTRRHPLLQALLAAAGVAAVTTFFRQIPIDGAFGEFFRGAMPRPLILLLMLGAAWDAWRVSRTASVNADALRLVALSFFVLVLRQAYGTVAKLQSVGGLPTDSETIALIQVWSTAINGVALLAAIMLEERAAIAAQAELVRVTELRLARSQRLESLGQMAGGIAHDFANMLTAISGGLEAARESRSEGELAEHVAFAETAVERATGLTRQLALFARQRPSNIATFGVGNRLQEIEPMLRRLAGHDVTLTLDRSAAPDPVLTMDPSQFDQILLNLLVNARDAMPAGGTISIRLTRSEAAGLPPEHREQMADGPVVTIQVEDTGVGIAPDVVERVFEPFFSTKGDRGTGLGLATVSSVVRASHGAVSVTSRINVGTTFSVHLPEG